MRKIISFFIVICILFATVSCAAPAKEDDTFHIVSSVYPGYDFLRNITDGADGVTLSLLVSGGVDMHNYQPTADDIIALSSADLVVYTGGVSEEWISNTLKENDRSLAMMDMVNALIEESVEGMESDSDVGDEFDEHVWLSPKNAISICRAICEKLCLLDVGNEQIYRTNTDQYIDRLNELDALYGNVISASEGDTLIFAGRFPFRYLCEDYGLNYYAAFPGCSAETNASFSTVVFLSEKVKELCVPCIFVIDNDDGSIAESIIKTASCDAKISRLVTMQTASDGEYIEIMKENLEVIKEALR